MAGKNLQLNSRNVLKKWLKKKKKKMDKSSKTFFTSIIFWLFKILLNRFFALKKSRENYRNWQFIVSVVLAAKPRCLLIHILKIEISQCEDEEQGVDEYLVLCSMQKQNVFPFYYFSWKKKKTNKGYRK